MAGRIRYLDSRPDEQTRGITMESSAISLFFSILRKSAPDAAAVQHDHLINLIDSPGHVDFSSEVSTASRLCDGAVVLVDAVEGVCSQTIAVLRQCWIEKLKPVLVINKMDRLITELKMSPGEANSHLSRLLEQVNAVMGSFFQGDRMEDDLKWRDRVEAKLNSIGEAKTDGDGNLQSGDDSMEFDESKDISNVYEEKDDEDIYFEPDRGNVIFASAIDGWAFTVKQFAGIYEKKLGIKRSVLEKVLWGEYYLDPKTKRILGAKHLKGRALKPMFTQLVLENLWAIYDATMGGDKGRGNPDMVEKITKSLNINLPAHVLRSRDSRALLVALFSAWIPLSTAVLVSVVEHLPSPAAAQAARMQDLIDASPGSGAIDNKIKEAMKGLRSGRQESLVAFVSKMVAVPVKDLPENKTRSGAKLTADEARELGRKKRAEIARAQAAANGDRPDLAELREALSETHLSPIPSATTEGGEEPQQEPNEERLIGFARLFCGTLEVGDEVYVLAPKFTPANPHAAPEPQKVTITALYLLMGRELEPLTSVPPGVVFGVAGLEGHIMKSGTLCSQLEGSVNLAGVNMGSQPIVRVALEPENPMDLDKMIKGLKMLQQSDPCAVYEVLENGEHVILTAGELHLERCLKDLRERFAGCEVQAGAPIVPYREGIVQVAEMNPPRDKDLPRGTVVTNIAGQQISIRTRVRPLPGAVVEYLLANTNKIRELYAEQEAIENDAPDGEEPDADEAAHIDITEQRCAAAAQTVEELKRGLQEALSSVKRDRDLWRGIVQRVVAFGPRRVGPNLLIDSTPEQICKEMSLETILHDATHEPAGPKDTRNALSAQDLASRVSYAFQLATASGPLCAEPTQGVAVFLESISIAGAAEDEATAADLLSARLVSDVIKNVRSAVHAGFLDWSPRLLLAMYSCEIQASADVLGRVYAVVTRRRGRIVAESMNEGTPFFTVSALLPVAESFGFGDEVRKRTSGAASPQLIFAGFEALDVDPFWVPSTEEELEDLGELADRENVAKRYVDGVRRKKGMVVAGEKLVVDPNKQKNLKR